MRAARPGSASRRCTAFAKAAGWSSTMRSRPGTASIPSVPKVVETMAMGKAIVSTTLGAEGIEAVLGRDLLVEDEPAAFADAVNRLLAEPGLAARIGQSARQLAVERYAWSGAAQVLEGFYRRILGVVSSDTREGRRHHDRI